MVTPAAYAPPPPRLPKYLGGGTAARLRVPNTRPVDSFDLSTMCITAPRTRVMAVGGLQFFAWISEMGQAAWPGCAANALPARLIGTSIAGARKGPLPVPSRLLPGLGLTP